MKKAITLILTLTMLLGLCAFSGTVYAADEITVTDMIGREVTVTPARSRSRLAATSAWSVSARAPCVCTAISAM